MYTIEKKFYGYKLTFGTEIKEEEMAQWVQEVERKLSLHRGSMGVFVDMRTLRPLTPEAQGHMQKGQKLFKEKGMERSVVILSSVAITMQFKRIAKETGIYDWERYINASQDPDWEKTGLDWIEKGIDPDK